MKQKMGIVLLALFCFSHAVCGIREFLVKPSVGTGLFFGGILSLEIICAASVGIQNLNERLQELSSSSKQAKEVNEAIAYWRKVKKIACAGFGIVCGTWYLRHKAFRWLEQERRLDPHFRRREHTEELRATGMGSRYSSHESAATSPCRYTPSNIDITSYLSLFEGQKQCPVCLDDYDAVQNGSNWTIASVFCGHLLCKGCKGRCIDTQDTPRCPKCRHEMDNA